VINSDFKADNTSETQIILLVKEDDRANNIVVVKVRFWILKHN